MVLVHGNIIPTKHVGERTDSLRSKNWILILKKIDLYFRLLEATKQLLAW
jgi:hypothetical protein